MGRPELIELPYTNKFCYKIRRMCLSPTGKAIIVALILLAALPLFGYGVLSHEELIDMVWDSNLRSALHKRFPAATEDDLQKAHAYAYGGSMIQDIGYYPFGSHPFTNYLHYVCSGDFVANLLRE